VDVVPASGAFFGSQEAEEDEVVEGGAEAGVVFVSVAEEACEFLAREVGGAVDGSQGDGLERPSATRP
jgi:hypothetical protein